MHRQPDAVFRLDFQLGWNADASAERAPEHVAERVRSMLGPRVPFTIEWSSVYTFRCARLDRLVHGRIAFVGDSAHVVSPFGARGGNGGVQDADNLCWKLAAVLNGDAPVQLIESYAVERSRACDENIQHASRTTRFMTPKSHIERELRDSVLALAAEFPFARALVNSGRLSEPCTFDGSAWLTDDDLRLAGPLVAGSPCLDAPVAGADGRRAWLLEFLGGPFVALTFASDARNALKCAEELSRTALPVALLAILPANSQSCDAATLKDTEGLVQERYGGALGVTYLVRPDQHVAARFPMFDADAIGRAHARALRGATA
jgi:3-(3-hydroxy-phenyl)propionate hydroxylase